MSDHENSREPRGENERIGQEHHDASKTDEDQAWMESDLSRLSDFEPYEWAEGELEAGEPVRYVPGIGAVACGEGDASLTRVKEDGRAGSGSRSAHTGLRPQR